MRGARSLVALLLLAVVVAPSALAGQGGAKGSHPVEAEPRMELVGSHGYRLLVSARQRTVTIGVSAAGNTERAGVSTTYVARGKVGPNGIHANFRQFGEVDVTFHPTAPAARGLPPDCFGGTTGAATIPGYFTGNIAFEGQGGYTAVHAHRVRGEVVLPSTEQCPWVAGGSDPLVEDPSAQLPPAKTRMSLDAWNKSGTGGLFFYAFREGKSGFVAEKFGTVGRIGLLGLAYAEGPSSTFTSDPAVTHATVHPPKPFVGSARLSRGPNGKRTWDGSLAVSFPGEGPVSLTGSQFHTRLSRSFP